MSMYTCSCCTELSAVQKHDDCEQYATRRTYSRPGASSVRERRHGREYVLLVAYCS